MIKLTYEDLDSRVLKDAIAEKEEIVVEVSPRHANALDTLVDIVEKIKSWPKSKTPVLKKWMTLEKAFILAIRALFSHSQLVELLPVLLSSEINVERSRGSDDSLALRIESK